MKSTSIPQHLQTISAIKEAIFWCQFYTNFKPQAMSTTPFVEFDLSQKCLERLITGSYSSLHTALVSSGTRLKKHVYELQGEHHVPLLVSPGWFYSGCPSALPYGRYDNLELFSFTRTAYEASRGKGLSFVSPELSRQAEWAPDLAVNISSLLHLPKGLPLLWQKGHFLTTILNNLQFRANLSHTLMS